MKGDYEIKLNFLAIEETLPSFWVYRTPRNESDSKPDGDVFGFSLPISDSAGERGSYWVRFSTFPGFEKFCVNPNDNNFLTCRALFNGLCQAVGSLLQTSEFEIPRNGFYEELWFNFTNYPEGQEQLTVQPYYLKSKRLFGWLIDFHFRIAEGIGFSRRIQQLSLSLDADYQRNLNYYLDRMNRIKSFLARRRSCFDNIILPGLTDPIRVENDFTSIPGKRLRSKMYQFSGNNISRGQFTGLRQYGPLEPISKPPRLLFAFRERDRQSARVLAMALQGSKKRERFSFPGFESLFKSQISIDGNPIILPDLTPESFNLALKRVKEERNDQSLTVPVFVLPDGEDNGYMQHKAIFTHDGIPTQVCTLSVINNDYSLKWSIANIALQIFCKTGGKPWKVRPSTQKTLIIGISQSHKIIRDQEHKKIEKYFAFSVMSDNSGLFQKLRVLGNADNEIQYLDDLKNNLRTLLSERSKDYSRVVVHTSFRLKHNEMRAIEDVVRAAADQANHGCRFAVVKVNQHNRFFGVNSDANSLVPYEGTVARLGSGEYLIWFEGIFPDKKTVTKVFSGPTHVKFLRVSDTDAIDDESLLQDLVNLSGANWRGFNAKSAPVSIFYCHLVADLVHDFHLRGLPLPSVQNLKPWFL